MKINREYLKTCLKRLRSILNTIFMPLHRDILHANFFDRTNARNRNNLEHLKGFGIISFISPSGLFKLIVEHFYTRRRPLVTSKHHFKLLEGFSTTKAIVDTTFRVLYWWRQQCKQISDRFLEKFKRIITLITGTVLFFFAFFNLILDAPRSNSIQFQHIGLHVHGGKGNIELELEKRDIFLLFLDDDFLKDLSHNGQLKVFLSCMTSWMCFQIARSCKEHLT